MLADKDVRGHARGRSSRCSTRSWSRELDLARAIDPDELAEIAVEVFGDDRVHVAARLDDAIDTAIGLAEEGGLVGGGVLVTGSITLAADVRRLLRAR